MEINKITLKQARLLAEKTQKEMAERLGVIVKTYRNVENNPEIATVSQAKMISQITGIESVSLSF